WPGYENLKPFMNGILADIQAPARLIHAWESTFWWGGTRVLPEGPVQYPGDRRAFATARNDIRNVWRNLSDNPPKYDQFVDVGMAAWVESDPYNLYIGWPSGYLTDLPWSNLPYALAYSDEYVWVFDTHTQYPQTKDVLNPFMASIANRTFNTGEERVSSVSEDFQTDPMKRGWYFDFDMLDIGQEVHEGFLPAMNTDNVAYVWSESAEAVQVKGAWLGGLHGDTVVLMDKQRRRYVRPLQPFGRNSHFEAEMDFYITDFGTDADNPIVLGLFNSDKRVDQQSLILRIAGSNSATVTIAGDGTRWDVPLSLSSALQTSRTYRIQFDYDGTSGRFKATLTDVAGSSVIAQLQQTPPSSIGLFELDEIGAAMWDAIATMTTPEQAYKYFLQSVSLTTILPSSVENWMMMK
ncbi:MAG TPA: hypothetical protein PKH07_09805, partial [bacterium]|nr:hypothetical protein [bacterium]